MSKNHFRSLTLSHPPLGSVGRAVASDSRGQQFESSHRQKFKLYIYCQLYWKDENKEKEAGNGQFLKAKLSPQKTGYAFTEELIFP